MGDKIRSTDVNTPVLYFAVGIEETHASFFPQNPPISEDRKQP